MMEWLGRKKERKEGRRNEGCFSLRGILRGI
jgi:hypothetical protein